MKKSLLFFAMLFIAIFATAQTDLFFSEYVEGSGNNKGVEIYNPTAEAIDLTNYWVARFSNGESTFTSGGVTQLTGMLEPYKTFVLVNGQTTSTPTSPACDPLMQALADQLDHEYPAPTYMNGNDAIALLKTPNGQTPLEDMSNVIPVDLIGQIGLGAAISAETGWSYVKDSTLTYNNSAGEPVTGKVVNHIVRKYATNGSDYGPFWMSWTSDHSLIRKSEVVQGVVAGPSPFKVSMEWDTVPGRIDPETGHIVYKDIWDNLGSHACYPVAVNDNVEIGNTQLATIDVLYNDKIGASVTLSIEQQATQGNAEITTEDPSVISYLANPEFIGLDSITYKISYSMNPSLSSNTATVYINVVDGSGVDDLSIKTSMIIYPNPVASKQFTITSDEMMKSAQVFDLLGKQVLEQTFAYPLNEAEVVLEAKYQGLYLIQINFLNGATTTQKILIK
jgi:hypothetical protein